MDKPRLRIVDKPATGFAQTDREVVVVTIGVAVEGFVKPTNAEEGFSADRAVAGAKGNYLMPIRPHAVETDGLIAGGCRGTEFPLLGHRESVEKVQL